MKLRALQHPLTLGVAVELTVLLELLVGPEQLPGLLFVCTEPDYTG